MKLTIGIAKQLLDEYDIDLIDCKPNGGLHTVLTDVKKKLRVVHTCKNKNVCFDVYINNLDTEGLVKELEDFVKIMKDFFSEIEEEEQDPEWKAIDDAIAEKEGNYLSWEMLYELVGASSQTWESAKQLSIRELQFIFRGKDKQLWNMVSNVLVAIVNTHTDKQNQINIEDVNPYAEPQMLTKEVLSDI